MSHENVTSLLSWVESVLPQLLGDLNPAASEQQVLDFENRHGVVFDAAFHALMTRHNGQMGKTPMGFFYGLEFLSLEQMETHWDSSTHMVRSGDQALISELSQFCSSHIEGKIQTLCAHEKWIPFAQDWGGNYLAIDFAPGPAGISGQVINTGRDEDEKFVVADSFDAFIGWYGTQLEDGNYVLADEGDGNFSLNTKAPPSRHFLDAVKTLFATS